MAEAGLVKGDIRPQSAQPIADAHSQALAGNHGLHPDTMNVLRRGGQEAQNGAADSLERRKEGSHGCRRPGSRHRPCRHWAPPRVAKRWAGIWPVPTSATAGVYPACWRYATSCSAARFGPRDSRAEGRARAATACRECPQPGEPAGATATRHAATARMGSNSCQQRPAHRAGTTAGFSAIASAAWHRAAWLCVRCKA